MTPGITFWFSLLSPWVYFSGPRLHEIAAREGARIAYRPIDLLRVFRLAGGTPLKDLHPSRQAYRRLERDRWSELLGMPVSAAPRHHPVEEAAAARLVIAAERAGHAPWPLAQSILQGVWVRDLDISDPATLAMIATEQGLDAAALGRAAAAPEVAQAYEDNTQAALAAGVFGVPSFTVGGELFFGQDRLDFVERALRRARGGAT